MSDASQSERIYWRIADALGLPRYTAIAAMEAHIAKLRADMLVIEAGKADLRCENDRLRAELERFGVRFVDDDEVIGVYWLPAPKGQPVAGSLREALEARAEELRAETAPTHYHTANVLAGVLERLRDAAALPGDSGAFVLRSVVDGEIEEIETLRAAHAATLPEVLP